MIAVSPDTTLYEVLALLGYTTGLDANGKRCVLRDGAVVFNGPAGDVWGWLRDTRQIAATCKQCWSDPCECDAADKRAVQGAAYEDHCERMGDEGRGQ